MTAKQADVYSETTTDFLNIGGVYSKNYTKKKIDELTKLVSRQRKWMDIYKLRENKPTFSHICFHLGKPVVSFFNTYNNELFVWGFFYEKSPVILTYVFQENYPNLDIQLDPNCDISLAIEIVSAILATLEKKSQ